MYCSMKVQVNMCASGSGEGGYTVGFKCVGTFRVRLLEIYALENAVFCIAVYGPHKP